MKSRMFLLAVMLFGAALTATSQNFTIDDFVPDADTLVNAATDNLTSKQITGYHAGASISLLVTKVSGTVGGSCVLQSANFLTAAGWSTVAGSDTLTLTNTATQTKTWPVTDNSLYYRIRCTGSGTMAAIPKARFVGKK